MTTSASQFQPQPQATIFALATPPGKSALAVYRISGPAAGDVLARMAGGASVPRRAALRRLVDPETAQILDEALVLWFPAPASETGEDVAELQVHGGRAVIAAVAAGLLKIPGVRLAEPGEFARRAFENGKIDLTAAEGLADLIDAETEAQRRQALRQSSGALGKLYDGWRAGIIEAMALMEAAIDFSDEADVQASAQATARVAARRVLAAIDAHLDDQRVGEIVRSGFKVVVAGPPNAGKSSLLNALSRRDVAIVSPEPGTTRDAIEVSLDLGGLPVIVTDTAGIRDTEGAIEQEGIRRARGHMAAADLVLWLTDASAEPLPPPPADLPTAIPVLRVQSKCDLIADLEPRRTQAAADLAISVATGGGLSALVDAIADRLRAHLPQPSEAPVITQARHRQHLEAARSAIAAFLEGSDDDSELRAEELRQAAAEIGRITGRVDPEDVLGAIFGRFCIGK